VQDRDDRVHYLLDRLSNSHRERRSDSPATDVDAEGQQAFDDREDLADKREAALTVREARVDALDALLVDRTEAAKSILADADERDDLADERDVAADKRDLRASLDCFLGDRDFDAALKARRSAAMDRLNSKVDRNSAAGDRSELTTTVPTPSDQDALNAQSDVAVHRRPSHRHE
jgi:hypothetical protein